MGPKEEPYKPAAEGGTEGAQPWSSRHSTTAFFDRDALAILFSPNRGNRDNALAALGDRVQAFKNLVHDFNLQRTSAFVESSTLCAGTSIFDVQADRAVVPSLVEISISIERKAAQDLHPVSVSLTCFFGPEVSQHELDTVSKALGAFDPVSVLDPPPTVTISFASPQGDVVPQLEAIFETLHRPSGLYRNMSVTAACDAILGLPELNQRAVEVFRDRVEAAAGDLLTSAMRGWLPDEATIDQTLRKLARAQGVITAFEMRKVPLPEGFIQRSADSTSAYFEAVSKALGSKIGLEATEQLSHLMREFVATEDLRGLCGLTALVMLGRHDAIFGVEEDNIIGAAGLLPEDKSSPWVTPRAIQAYDELLDTCLEKLPLLATSRDTAALINSFSNAIRAENLQFDQRLGEAEREASCEPPTIHAPPQWVQNSFLLASELYQREKDPGVKEVLSGMVSMLADSGERLRALLVQYSVVKPSLQATVLGLIEEKSFVSSPVTIADEVHETVKALLPPEVTHSIHTMINYLADDYAIQNDVLGYKVGEGVCKDRSKS